MVKVGFQIGEFGVSKRIAQLERAQNTRRR